MISLARLLLDRAEAGRLIASVDVEAIPTAQWEVYFAELAQVCPSRLAVEPTRQRNALRVELLPSTEPRCLRRPPDEHGARYLLSGGSPLAYGPCREGACPRAGRDANWPRRSDP